MEWLKRTDPEIYEIIRGEIDREHFGIELIASENFVSPAVLEAMGQVMTNKYAEGYPEKRYYGGCEFVDRSEQLAIDRAKQLFNAKWANVQPHAGAQANMAVYMTFLQPGDTILGMNLAHGGHLTHGSPVNFSGRLYNVVPYGVKQETGMIDYDEVRKLTHEHKPKLIMTGASAYPRFWDFAKFRGIADEVGAVLVADIAHVAGHVACKLHPDPIPCCHAVTSTTHKTLRGPRGGLIMSSEEGGEILLKNMPNPKTYWEAMDSMVFPGTQGGPLEHVIAAKAVAFKEAMTPEFKTYSEQTIKNAKVLAETLIGHDYDLVSKGTDNHLMLVDLTNTGRSGKPVEASLERAGITVNKNMVPFDQRTPFNPSGIRIGTPAVTTRGMKEPEMKIIGDMIHRVISNPKNEQVEQEVRQQVRELCESFPLYRDL
jgi:glycine hydroxymethyltransferase